MDSRSGGCSLGYKDVHYGGGDTRCSTRRRAGDDDARAATRTTRARAGDRARARGVMRRAVVALARAIERERGLKAAVATGGADARSLMTTATATGGGATVATTRARGDAWGLTAQMVARRGWKKANRRVEVILKESIPGLGETDEVASVRPGRARNHLVPCGLATYVNEEKLAAAKERLARREAERAMEEEGAEGANGDAISAEEEEKERKVRRACEV